MIKSAVFSESEQFKRGAIAGFYDAVSDDGLRYIDDLLRFGVRGKDDADFMSGYRHGCAERRQAASSQLVDNYSLFIAAHDASPS
jgi:hypothetical protein